MKRWICLLLVALLLTGCGKAPQEEPFQPGSTTVMVYMIGCDPKDETNAGAQALQRMAAALPQPGKTQVVVLAGAEPLWYNQTMTGSENTLLELAKDGFAPVETVENSSMGSADTLASFLKYAAEHYPAERYSLLVWDANTTPVVGYGRESLTGEDSLSVPELVQALAASPFGEERKLSWVGFESPMMASLEICCVLADYADYLVASQSAIPACGWDYSFLSRLEEDVAEVLTQLTQDYQTACQAYYDNGGAVVGDVALSCLKLSGTDALETAADALFVRAEQDLATQQATITAKLLQAYPSRYDLLDLADVVTQLEGLYPQEAAAVKESLAAMTLANSTSAQRYCGMNIHFPFTGEESEPLEGVLVGRSQFQATLKAMQIRQSYAGMPEKQDETTFTLALTEEQQANFLSASYRILRREGESIYAASYFSPEVKLEDGVLRAQFSGNLPYLKNNFGRYAGTIASEHGTVKGLTYCTIRLLLDESTMSGQFGKMSNVYRLCYTLDKATGETKICSLYPFDMELSTAAFEAENWQDSLAGWNRYFIYRSPFRYATWDEVGALKGYADWNLQTTASGLQWAVGDGLELVNDPLTEGEYYFVFEITDTQGNTHCSELLPLETVRESFPDYELPETKTQWNTGKRHKLLETTGVSLYMRKAMYPDGSFTYLLEAENATDSDVYLGFADVVCNGNIAGISLGLSSMNVPAGGAVTAEKGVSFGQEVEIGDLDQLELLQFRVELRDGKSGARLCDDQLVSATLGEEVQFSLKGEVDGDFQITGPYRDLMADEQVVYDRDGMRVTLLAAGQKGNYSDVILNFRMENDSDSDRAVYIRGYLVNGAYFKTSELGALAAHRTRHTYTAVSRYDLDYYGIESIESLTLVMQEEGVYGKERTYLYPVELSHHGTAVETRPEGQVLFSENGVTLYLLESSVSGSYAYWTVMLENNSPWHVRVDDEELKLDGVASNETFILDMTAPSGAYMVKESTLYGKTGQPLPEQVQFGVRIRSLDGDEILFETDAVVTLTPAK